MKFDCGKTPEERNAELKAWHDWFAWIPVRVGSHDCRWLEIVERKGTMTCGWGECFWRWEVRAK